MPTTVTQLPAAPAWDLARVTAELARITRRLDAQEFELDRTFAAGVAYGESRAAQQRRPSRTCHLVALDGGRQ